MMKGEEWRIRRAMWGLAATCLALLLGLVWFVDRAWILDQLEFCSGYTVGPTRLACAHALVGGALPESLSAPWRLRYRRGFRIHRQSRDQLLGLYRSAPGEVDRLLDLYALWREQIPLTLADIGMLAQVLDRLEHASPEEAAIRAFRDQLQADLYALQGAPPADLLPWHPAPGAAPVRFLPGTEGTCRIGCAGLDCPPIEWPRQDVALSTHQMLSHEVPWGLYGVFDPQRAFERDPRAPVRGIQPEEAAAFALWLDARLPTEAEFACALEQGQSDGKLEGLGLVELMGATRDAPPPPPPGLRPDDGLLPPALEQLGAPPSTEAAGGSRLASRALDCALLRIDDTPPDARGFYGLDDGLEEWVSDPWGLPDPALRAEPDPIGGPGLGHYTLRGGSCQRPGGAPSRRRSHDPNLEQGVAGFRLVRG